MPTDTSNFSFQGVGIVNSYSIDGCINPLACNFDPLATIDDGSCLTVYGCTNPLASNYEPLAECDDGTCNCVGIYGCINPIACNYDPIAECDDGSCILPDGCTDPAAINYDPNATCDDLSCIDTAYGCMDPVACNYDANANIDDGSCTYYGCMDQSYLEYDPLASCPDPSMCITLIVNGCTDPTMFGYNPLANVDDGSCVPIVTGCTDPNASSGYDPNANTNDGSCVYTGCTDITANNYDPTANQDDGSCTYGTFCDSCGNCIGDYHQGGIIFYLDGNCGGLIAAPVDQSNWMSWDYNNHCTTTLTGAAGADGVAIGTGAANQTALMTFAHVTMAVPCNSDPWTSTGSGPRHLGAAQICEDYSNDGYNDWFLPSKDELKEMINTIGLGQTDPTATNSTGVSLINIGNLDTTPGSTKYWSSTESQEIMGTWPLPQPHRYSYVYSNCNGCYSLTSSIQHNHHNVRAVRAF